MLSHTISFSSPGVLDLQNWYMIAATSMPVLVLRALDFNRFARMGERTRHQSPCACPC